MTNTTSTSSAAVAEKKFNHRILTSDLDIEDLYSDLYPEDIPSGYFFFSIR